jgi:hypothetical protein
VEGRSLADVVYKFYGVGLLLPCIGLTGLFWSTLAYVWRAVLSWGFGFLYCIWQVSWVSPPGHGAGCIWHAPWHVVHKAS